MKDGVWYEGRAADWRSQELEAGLVSFFYAFLVGKVELSPLGWSGGGLWFVVQCY